MSTYPENYFHDQKRGRHFVSLVAGGYLCTCGVIFKLPGWPAAEGVPACPRSCGRLCDCSVSFDADCDPE